MSKYNKIYFLHIPKTGGRFFTKYILEPIETTLKENGIDVVKLPPNVLKHGGWHKEIDDKTYVVSVFRDPVGFFVSVIAHMFADEEKMLDENKDHIVRDKTKILDIPVDAVRNKIVQLDYLKNFQSQNFILSPTENHIIQESIKEHNKGNTIDSDLVYERIKRVNLMIRHEDLKTMDYSTLISKISNDLGIDINIELSSADREHYKNNSSEALLNKLSKDDIDLIYNNFLFDKEIYQNDLLFWNKKF
jgi:hypothetical protein